MNTARQDIILHVSIVLLSGFLIGLILPFGLTHADHAPHLLILRVTTGLFAPVMALYLGKDKLNAFVAGSLFILIGVLLTVYLGGIVTGIVSLRAKMAMTFALLLALLWDILVLVACLLSNLN